MTWVRHPLANLAPATFPRSVSLAKGFPLNPLLGAIPDAAMSMDQAASSARVLLTSALTLEIEGLYMNMCILLTYTFKYIYIYMYACVNMYVYIYIWKCMCIYVYMYICIYVCMYVCTYVCNVM